MTARGASAHRAAAIGADALMLLLAGLLYAWSIFVTPLEAEFGWLRAQTSMTYTISVACNTLCGLLAARLTRKIGPQWVLRAAALGVLAGFWLASRTQTLWQLYLSYGVLCAGSLGMVYNVIIGTVIRWAPKRPGALTGVMLMCYGLGAMVFGSLVSRLIEASGWRAAFAVMGAACFAALLAGSFLVRGPADAGGRSAARKETGAWAARELSPRTMVREKSFWLFALWILTLATVGLILTSHAAPIAQELGIGARTAALYVGAVSVSNGVSRLVFGVVFDRIGRRWTMLVISFLGVAGGALLWIAWSGGWRGLLLAAFVLLGAAFGGTPVSSANYTKAMYGQRNYAENLAFGNLAVLVAAYLGPYLAGMIYQTAGYRLVFIAVLVLSGLSALLGGLLYRLKETASAEASAGILNYEKG